MEPGNVATKKSVVTVKNVIRVLALLCIVGVFCPSFLVSCSGQTIDVSVMTAVGGISAYGETVVEPHLIMLICLLIPVAVLVILFIKKMAEKMSTGIILVCSVIDLIVWIIFRSEVKKIAEENY
jgi:ABC-type dipeptide/oligopeptide/nickel transport system permease subunit